MPRPISRNTGRSRFARWVGLAIQSRTTSRGVALPAAPQAKDPHLRTNLAIGDLGVVAYAGVPLMDANGQTLGAMCAIGHQPREWTREDVSRLAGLVERASEEIGRR